MLRFLLRRLAYLLVLVVIATTAAYALAAVFMLPTVFVPWIVEMS